MTDEKLEEEEANQTHTKTIQAKEFTKGKIPLDYLPQPYVIISDSGEFENLSKTINILAIKQNYRIVSFAATDVDDGILIMDTSSWRRKPSRGGGVTHMTVATIPSELTRMRSNEKEEVGRRNGTKN
jgi:hypothetical protein